MTPPTIARFNNADFDLEVLASSEVDPPCLRLPSSACVLIHPTAQKGKGQLGLFDPFRQGRCSVGAFQRPVLSEVAVIDIALVQHRISEDRRTQYAFLQAQYGQIIAVLYTICFSIRGFSLHVHKLYIDDSTTEYLLQ